MILSPPQPITEQPERLAEPTRLRTTDAIREDVAEWPPGSGEWMSTAAVRRLQRREQYAPDVAGDPMQRYHRRRAIARRAGIEARPWQPYPSAVPTFTND